MSNNAALFKLLACTLSEDISIIREALLYCGDDLKNGTERDSKVGQRMLELATELDVTVGDIAQQLGLAQKEDLHEEESE